MKTIGFLINPIAGLGGAVGLKGTDGLAEKARNLGAKPTAEKRAKEALQALAGAEALFLTCSGAMGEKALAEEGLSCEVVYSAPEETTAKDTLKACGEFLARGCELIVFCGGDGTARDIFSVVGDKAPILGIPAGVKMHSAVFAVNPKAAGELMWEFLTASLPLKDAEVMDIDEEAYRRNRLSAKLYGYAKIPYRPELVQAGKDSFSAEEDEESKENIARFAAEFMRDGSLYVVGAGSTTKKIKDMLGVEGTLLGVDLIKDGRLLAKDASEKEIIAALEKEPKAKILVSVIGAQGFVFGRGNQQISSEVIRLVGTENIIVVATPHKLAHTLRLRVDTGDPRLDEELSGSMQVVCGYRMAQRKMIEAP